MDAELGSAPGFQDVLDIVATVGHVAASAWMGYVPPAGLDLRGEEGFIELMRMAFRNVKPRESEA